MRRLLILSSLCFTLISQGQILDTSGVHEYIPPEVYRFSEHGLMLMEIDSHKVDTQLYDFYNYYTAYEQVFPLLDLGYEGSPVLTLAGPVQASVGLNLEANPVGHYFKTDTQYSYLSKHPFTRLNYSQGDNELISIEVKHFQQISNRLTFGVDYNRLKNQNIFYSNINNPNRRFANLYNSKFHIGYFSPDRRYELLFTYRWAKSINIETGGLTNPAFFNSLSRRNKEGNNPIFLNDANNLNAINQFSLIQYYRIGGVVDSNNLADLNKFRTQFVWKSDFYQNRLKYTDDNPDSSFYGKEYGSIEDSLHHLRISNSFQILLKLATVKLLVGAQHRLDKVYQNGISESFNTIYMTAETHFKYKAIGVNANWNTAISGYNLGDYLLNAEALFNTKSIGMSAFLRSSLTEPFYFDQQLYTTHRKWNLNLDKIATNSLGGQAMLVKGIHSLRLNLGIHNYTNLVYYDSTDGPSQFSGNIQHLETALSYSLNWRPLSFRGKLINQQISEQDILPRPQWSANASLFTNVRLFKKKLNVQLGLRGYWFQDFNAPMYNPYIRRWVNQDSLFKSYPPIEAFLNAKVLGFNFGVSMFHVQEGLMSNAFYASPAYPLMPRMLRINIRWDLRN